MCKENQEQNVLYIRWYYVTRAGFRTLYLHNSMRTDHNTTKICTRLFFHKDINIMTQKQGCFFGLRSPLNMSTGVVGYFSIKPSLVNYCCKALHIRCFCGLLPLNVFNNSQLSHTNKQMRNSVKTLINTVQNHGMKLQRQGFLVH